MRLVPAARRSSHPASAAFDDPTPRPPGVPTIADALPQLTLNGLELTDEARVEHVELTGDLPTGTDARSATIEDVRIRGSLAGAKLHDLHLHDAQLTGADLANVDLQGAHLSRLTIANCRMTGAQLIETTLIDLTLTDCRLDFAVLGLARLDRVVFRGCDLQEASLEQTQLRDVRFESCDLRRATFGQSRHQRVQMHGCRLDGLRAVSDLQGVAMPFPDIVDQAQAFAAALGISVVLDPDNDA
jgi:uncharacterized protein YjbI with pentapeptide repeats